MTAPYVRLVRTNVRAGKGRATEQEIGRLTLIVGDNGIGKTRWQNALELALTGTADDVWLRRMTKEADLAVLVPHGEDRLYATATFDGGEEAEYGFKFENGKTKAQPHKLPAWLSSVADWVLPVREVYTAFASGPDKARVFFLPFMAPDGNADDIKRRLVVEYHNPETAGGKTPASTKDLLSFISLAESRGREEHSKKKAGEALAKDMRAAVFGPDPSNEALQGSRRLVLAYQRIIERMASENAAEEAAQRVAQAQAQANALRQQEVVREQQRAHDLHVVDQQILQADQWLAWAKNGGLDGVAPDPGPLPPSLDLWKRVLETGRAHAEVLAEALPIGLDRCHGCGNPTTPQGHAAVIPYLDQQLQMLHKQIEDWQAKKAARVQCLAQVAQAEHQRGALVSQRNMLASMPLGSRLPEGSVGYVPPAPPPEVELVPLPAGAAMPTTLEDGRRMLSTAEESERILLGLREKWTNIREVEARATEAGKTKLWWDLYEVALRKVVGEMLDESASRFCERAQRYMPSQWKLHLQLRDGVREVFRLGLVEDGAVNMAPSGAQLAAAAIAVALTCLESLPDGPPPFALITLPEERDWDGKTLAAVMRALADCPFQVLLTSTTEPAGRDPKGWTIIRLSESKRKGKGVDGEGAVEKEAEVTVAEVVVRTESPVPTAPPAPTTTHPFEAVPATGNPWGGTPSESPPNPLVSMQQGFVGGFPVPLGGFPPATRDRSG